VITLASDIRSRFVKPAETESYLTGEGDHVYAHGLLFLRDALLLRVFQHGIKTGDPGIVLRVIKFWFYAFRGSGKDNYARESLEILVQWGSGELTEEMKCALEATWFYNRWGLRNRFIPSDLYLEHLNYWLKVNNPSISILIVFTCRVSASFSQKGLASQLKTSSGRDPLVLRPFGRSQISQRDFTVQTATTERVKKPGSSMMYVC
jgi:hypothetical protein